MIGRTEAIGQVRSASLDCWVQLTLPQVACWLWVDCFDFTGKLDLWQKSKTHPPKVPPSLGGKPEKLGSRTASSGRVGEESGAFLQEV